jgi:hypothetical protein
MLDLFELNIGLDSLCESGALLQMHNNTRCYFAIHKSSTDKILENFKFETAKADFYK